jgi:hypothetical protein
VVISIGCWISICEGYIGFRCTFEVCDFSLVGKRVGILELVVALVRVGTVLLFLTVVRIAVVVVTAAAVAEEEDFRTSSSPDTTGFAEDDDEDMVEDTGRITGGRWLFMFLLLFLLVAVVVVVVVVDAELLIIAVFRLVPPVELPQLLALLAIDVDFLLTVAEL